MKPWVKSGLLWAAIMILLMTFVVPPIFEFIGFGNKVPEKFPMAKFIINIIVFTTIGLMLSYRNRNNTKKPKKQIDA